MMTKEGLLSNRTTAATPAKKDVSILCLIQSCQQDSAGIIIAAWIDEQAS